MFQKKRWAGLAGLRAGYALGDARIIERMLAIKQPYNVNVAAEALYVSAYYCIYVLNNTTHVSSILLYVSSIPLHMCSQYYYICVLNATIYVSSILPQAAAQRQCFATEACYYYF